MTEYPNTDKFNDLLSRFVEHKNLSPDLVKMTYCHLFEAQQAMPFFIDSALSRAVEYLTDIMCLNKLTTLDEVLAHFDSKRRSMLSFIDSIQLESDGPFPFQPDSSSPIAWLKPVSEDQPLPSTDEDIHRSCYCATQPLSLLPVNFRTSCVVLAPKDYRVREENASKGASNPTYY